jgi:hypothetical protein
MTVYVEYRPVVRASVSKSAGARSLASAGQWEEVSS